MGGKSQKRYTVQAKRQNENRWTEWTRTDDYDEAMRQIHTIEGLGYCGRIVDAETPLDKTEFSE